MRLWRISNYANLSGEGGRRDPARWNSKGHPVVYLAESPALALLENLVHLEVDEDQLPDTYQLLEIEVPNASSEEQTAESLTAQNALWRQDIEFTRAIGDRWLVSGSSLLLRLPSIILPNSTNVLFNPAHPRAKTAKIVGVSRPPYDRRLLI